MKWHLRILPNKETEQANQELRILEEDVAAARDFLQKNRKTYFQGKKNIPIYLILGPSRFGKSTILSQAGLDLINVHEQPFDSVTPTKYCSFWFTKDAIYIDTAGNYTKPDTTKPRNDMIWRGFIKLLQKYFGKDSISSILIVLDLPAISQDENLLKRTLFCIRERVYDLATLVKNIHAHIIFTKCDRILGFAEFFSFLDAKERLEPFGISFPNDKRDLIASFEDGFDNLLQNLNNRVIENLQRSVRPEDRSLIKLFPSQIDHLRQVFIDVIGKIPNSSQILLSGIYFTSSIQDGAPINPIKKTLLRIFNLKEKSTHNPEANDNRSYFIKEIFEKTIRPLTPKQKKKTQFSLPRFHIDYIYALIILISVTIISSFIGYKSYQKNINTIDQVQISLQSSDIYDPNSLHKILEQTKQNSESWWLTFGINKIKTIYNSHTKAHQILLIQKLTSQLENNFDAILDSKDLNKSLKLYQNLQTYLMFETHEKLDPEHIKTWFNNYWTKTYNDEEKDNLQKQLDVILNYKFKIELNQQLIDTVRDYLNNLPPIQLAYLLLESKYTNQNFSINNNKHVFKIYTKENFYKTYNESIPKLINNFPKHDWVLEDLKLNFETKEKESIEALREFYIVKYVDTWKNIIKLNTKNEPKNLKELEKYLNTISSTNSPLSNILKQIKQNTNIKNPPTKLTEELNTKLERINNLDPKNLQKNLNQLTSYITDISKDSNPNKESFNSIIKHLQDKSADNPISNLQKFAENQPDWLKSYLQTITKNSWRTLLNASYEFIKHDWNQKIIPEYKEKMLDKYPLFKNSKEDISLEDFSKFFGPHGSIDKFFKKYIEPLVDTQKTKWEWKSINGQKINFSSNFLEIFLRASMIKKMFFSSKSLKPKLSFRLTPVAMTPNTQKFTLHIDGQKISFANNANKKTERLVWPGPQPGSVTINFVNDKGKYFTTSEFGSWAWFRILDKTNVTSNNNTKLFELAFNLNGNTAKYILNASETVNPFISGVINKFRCTEE